MLEFLIQVLWLTHWLLTVAYINKIFLSEALIKVSEEIYIINASDIRVG